ncbi:MAG: hypothetical protein ACJ8FY_21010 [Gemmataceae bacterium]
MSESLNPSEGAIKEARKFPNGWVYEIDPRYDCHNYIPPQAIKGAWKVDKDGNIVGQFIPNPNYEINILVKG